jgi:hypothetical protein
MVRSGDRLILMWEKPVPVFSDLLKMLQFYRVIDGFLPKP